MIENLTKKIFGTQQSRKLKKLQPTVEKIKNIDCKRLKDEEFPKKTQELKQRLENGEPLDSLLPEAFALVQEAAWRTLKMRHYDVQLLGGIVLYKGAIAEMATGEGKTLVAPLAAYTRALTGKSVHVVTVNEYLAKRDAEWMGAIYKFLGMTCRASLHNQTLNEKKEVYASDIVYSTNVEIGFDYLRNNMAMTLDEVFQRDFYYAIVDEVDSILIDEARTPLVISAPIKADLENLRKVDKIIKSLPEDAYEVDYKTRRATLTDLGITLVEKGLGIDNLYDTQNAILCHRVEKALIANLLYKKDEHYLIRNDEVCIIDEFTGRVSEGRRFSDGIHQAIEAKEGVSIRDESETIASISYQNLFRQYEILAGMTGTAETEAREFIETYGLDVYVIPTNKPLRREDMEDVVFKTSEEKWKAAVEKIKELNKKRQPVLVGTASVRASEDLAFYLTKAGVDFQLLNAKNHEKEAEIIAQAGKAGRVTVATNMAGRGTDIKLDEEARKAGGLFVLGTERHESRRIDNQLRGRSGRQGDPGASQFYVSLEDSVLKDFGLEALAPLLDKLGYEEGQPMSSPMLSKAIERAQKKLEGLHFEARKNVLEFDSVNEEQRRVVFSLRKDLLFNSTGPEFLEEFIEDEINSLIQEESSMTFTKEQFEEVSKTLREKYFILIQIKEPENKLISEFKEELTATFKKIFSLKKKELQEDFRPVCTQIVLKILDFHWKNQMVLLEYLRENASLAAFKMEKPIIVYKKEAYEAFVEFLHRVRSDSLGSLFRLQKVQTPEALQKPTVRKAPEGVGNLKEKQEEPQEGLRG